MTLISLKIYKVLVYLSTLSFLSGISAIKVYFLSHYPQAWNSSEYAVGAQERAANEDLSDLDVKVPARITSHTLL